MKTWVIVLIILILLILMSLWYQPWTVTTSSQDERLTETSLLDSTPKSRNEPVGGEAHTCEFSMVQDGNRITGVTSVSQERGYYYSHMKNLTQNSSFYVVADGQYVYTWSIDDTTGKLGTSVGAVRAPIPTEGTSGGSYAPFGGAIYGDPSSQSDCKFTDFDESKLSIPSNIEFFDYNY